MSWHPLCPTQLTLRSSLKSKLQLLRQSDAKRYEVSQAQKALLLLPHTAKGVKTSSEELNAQISPRTDDEHNLPYHEDDLQEH